MAGNCRSSQRKMNDPRCKHEQLILDDVCRYFQEDVEVATEKISPEEIQQVLRYFLKIKTFMSTFQNY
jgi:hypothetical protein